MIINLDDSVERILKYSEANPELKKSHHFLFNLPLADADVSNVEYVVLGMNPGESDEDWKLNSQPMQQETHLSDFHDVDGRGRASVIWTNRVREFCGSLNVIQTEAFFWSSKKLNKEYFDSRFGYSFKSLECRKHLEFCRDENMQLLNHHCPKAVILPGLGLLDIVPEIYNLSPSCVLKCPVTGHRLIEKYHSEDGTPWVFTKHWSGARGFTKEQRFIIADYIQSL